MKYSEIINQVSKELDIHVEVIDKAYKASFNFIKEKIQSLPLKEDINEEECLKLRTNFNIPSLGKLVCTFDRMMGVKKRFNYIKKLRKDVES